MNALPDESYLDTVLQLGTLRAQAEKILGGSIATLPLSGLTLEEQRLVWERAIAFEESEEKSIGEHLANNLSLRLSELSTGCPAQQLRSIIEGLGRIRIYLDFTNHLDDRELLDLLQREILPKVIFLPSEGGCLQLDLDEFPTADQSDPALLHLQYYADESFRRQVAENFPDCPLPPVRPLKSDRDDFLPRPASGR